MKNLIKVFVFLIAFFAFYSLFADWENFKAGLTGKAPVERSISE